MSAKSQFLFFCTVAVLGGVVAQFSGGMDRHGNFIRESAASLLSGTERERDALMSSTHRALSREQRGDVSQSGPLGAAGDLLSAVRAKQELEAQQDRLVQEIIDYRRRVRELEDRLASVGPASAEPGRSSKSEQLRLEAELKKLKERTEGAEELLQTLKASNLELQSEIEAVGEEKAKLVRQIEELNKALEQAKRDTATHESLLAKMREEKQTVESELDEARSLSEVMVALKKELEEAKNTILMRETEISLLRSQGGAKEPQKLSAAPTPPAVPTSTASVSPAASSVSEAPRTNDALVVEVMVDKANLRAGPGEEHSPVMQVGQGVRLMVEAREGDWYRVISPTNTRAYVRSDVVRLHRDGGQGRAILSSVPSVAPAKRPLGVASEEGLVPFGDVAKMRARMGRGDMETLAVEHLRRALSREP